MCENSLELKNVFLFLKPKKKHAGLKKYTVKCAAGAIYEWLKCFITLKPKASLSKITRIDSQNLLIDTSSLKLKIGKHHKWKVC